MAIVYACKSGNTLRLKHPKYSSCSRPILTYSGQGVNKIGVHANHHAIIYSGKRPIAFRGEKEKGLTMRPINVAPDNPRHKLDDASRLNYAKTYTVEYNVKVWFIGKVSSDSEWQLSTDYNRIHPPLENEGVPAPNTSDNTYWSSTDDISEESWEPVRENGDPLHDGDSDDNGDQGDQDRGGGQRRCEKYSTNSRRRR